MIVYLHGFRSSPQSFKARVIEKRMQTLGQGQNFLCPQLPASPRLAIELAQRILQPYPAQEVCLIGSSLGGFYATWLAEQSGCRAVLLNPAVAPFADLEKHVGLTTGYHSNEPFEFKPEYIEELKDLAVHRITRPERYFLMAATGDEVLDWRQMVAHYPGARHFVIQGSDHGISEFESYVDEVLTFCGVQAAAA